MGQKKRKPRKRTVGRPSREDLGLEPTVQVTVKVEESIVNKLKEEYGTIRQALKHLAAQ